MSKKQQLSNVISFASQDKAMVKRALLCRTGSFDGMFGPVKVTPEILQLICLKYKSDKVNPTNENDFAPILIDHNRAVDNTKGRLLADGMEVAEWKEIDGEMQMGLYGNLRIDDQAAQAAVESGKYAQLSISFDEETGELFEVSFVAVEAARGSIVLSQGGKVAKDLRLAQLAKHKALGLAVREARTKRRAVLSKLIGEQKALMAEITQLQGKAGEIALAVKVSQLKGKFIEFVKGGKMTPSEIKKLDYKELAALGESSMKVVLAAYEGREVSSDVVQHGQSGGKAPKINLAPEAMREAIALQRAGKGGVVALEAEEDDKDPKKLSEEKPEEEMEMYSMGKEEWSKCLEDMAGVHAKLAEVIDKVKGMGGDAEKLAKEEDKDEEKEKDMAADGPTEEPKEKPEGEE